MPTENSTSTNLSLIGRIAANDGQAWQELVTLYRPLVAFWCRKLSVPEQQIDDTIQDVFFAVSRSIDQYQPLNENGSFRSWLWTITRHKVIDAVRRQVRQAEARGGSTAMLASYEIAEQIDEQDATEQTQWSSLVHRAVEQVRGEFEESTFRAFWRSTVEGIAIAQVAEELEMKPATVRKYRSRVLRRLREQLGDC